MNLKEEIEKLINKGYNEDEASARLSQDIILKGISNSKLNRNITIKGGVVMRNLSKNIRRSTLDIDIDLISHPLTNKSIDNLINIINTIDDIDITKEDRIEDLKHQEYKGKRIYIVIHDVYDNTLTTKVDIGIHKDISIKQEEYLFDICWLEDGVSLLINTPSQMIAEKFKSLLRFGTNTTRYKDIFDINYLLDKVDISSLNDLIEKLIYKDSSLNINKKHDILKVINDISNDKEFLSRIKESDKNWLDKDVHNVFDEIISFIKNNLEI